MSKDYETGVLGGIATWAHLDKAEVFQGQSTGKLSITIQPTVKDAQLMADVAAQAWENFKENELKGKKLRGEPNLGIKEDKEGNNVFKFVANEKIHTRDGKLLKKNIPIFDGAGREVTSKILKKGIGNGSNVIVSYQLYPYYNSSTVYGVSLRMQGIQIVKYVPFGGHDASSMGFGKIEGGFDASSLLDDEDDTEINDEEIPFEDDASDF